MKRNVDRCINSTFFVVLLKKFDAITVSLVALGIGWFLIANPQVLDYSKAYDILSKIFTSQVFGVLFILVGVTKIGSIIFNSTFFKVVSISCMVGLWLLFGAALFQSNSLNSVYIHCFGWGLLSFGVAIREMIE